MNYIVVMSGDQPKLGSNIDEKGKLARKLIKTDY